VRTLSDIAWEPHRLIAIGTLCVLMLGAFAGGYLRRRPRLYLASVLVVPFAGAASFEWICDLDFFIDQSMLWLAFGVTILAWVAGTAVTGRGLARGIAAVVLAPTLALLPVLWARDGTPQSRAVAMRAFIARFHHPDYECSRWANDGSVGAPRFQYACTGVTGPVYWIGLDDRGHVSSYMLSAP
jgi:hypothetical protein